MPGMDLILGQCSLKIWRSSNKYSLRNGTFYKNNLNAMQIPYSKHTKFCIIWHWRKKSASVIMCVTSIYVDAIIQHMTGDGSGIGSGGSSWDAAIESYPGVPYDTNNFHKQQPDECTSSTGSIEVCCSFVSPVYSLMLLQWYSPEHCHCCCYCYLKFC